MDRTPNTQSRYSNNHFEHYLNVMQTNSRIINRIMDHIQVTERTTRSQLEHNRTMDQQLFNILNAPRTHPSPVPPPARLPRHNTQTFNWNNLALSPVRVIPNQTQIRRATTDTTFREISNPSNLLCPITQQPFENNDEVTIIDHCHHIFTRRDLSEWFGSNVRCPVCRFDIRDHQEPDPIVPTDDDEEYSAEELPISTRTERNILNSLAESINDEIERLSSNGLASSTTNDTNGITTNNNTDNNNLNEREFIMDPSGNLIYRFTLRPRLGDNPGDD
jgi:hypothetical protein